MTDDEFMNMSAPASSQPSNAMTDDQFMNMGAKSSTDTKNQETTSSPGEEAFRQVGLAGRDIAGAVPMAVAGAGDAINSGINGATGLINHYAGTSIPQLGMPTEDVQKGLSATGIFPEYKNNTEKNVGTAASVMLGGGEGGYDLAKQAGANALDYGKDAVNAVTAPVKTLKAGFNAMKPEGLQAASDVNFSNTSDTYAQMRANGAVYHPDSVQDLADAVNTAYKKSDVLPELSPKTQAVVQRINQAAESDEPISLNHVDQFRRLLRGASSEDSAAAGAVRQAIDNHVNSTTGDDLVNGSPDAIAWLNRGRAEYTRAANFDDVSTLLQKANGDPTKIKNSLNNFLSDETNTRGMTSGEIAMLRRASQTSSLESMSKMLGKAGLTIIPTNASGNGVFPYLMAATKVGGATAIPGGMPLVAAGTAARAGNTLYGRGLAQQALDAIGNRALPEVPAPSVKTPPLELPSPDIRPPPGGFTSSQPEATTAQAMSQKLLPRGNEDTFYQPQGRTLTYQPSPDFTVSPEGWASQPSTTSIRQNPDIGRPLNEAKQSLVRTSNRAPQKQLTYQPRPDFISTPEMTSNVPNEQSGDFQLGATENMPFYSGDLTAMRRMKGNKRGAPVNKQKGGRVITKPKSYPALEKRV